MTKHLQLYYGATWLKLNAWTHLEELSIYSGIYIGTEKSMTKFFIPSFGSHIGKKIHSYLT